MVDYRVYVDDSGSERNRDDPSFILAGYLAPIDHWLELSDAWVSALELFKLDHFHMTDVEARKGTCDGWTKIQRDSCVKHFVGIIEKYIPVSLGARMPMDEWRPFQGRVEHSPQLRESLGKAYDQTYLYLLVQLSVWLKLHERSNDQVELVFAKPFRVSNMGRSVANQLFVNNPFLDPIARETKKIPGLQAADVCAWLYGRIARIESSGKGYLKRHTRYEGIFRPTHLFDRIPESFIKKVREFNIPREWEKG